MSFYRFAVKKNVSQCRDLVTLQRISRKKQLYDIVAVRLADLQFKTKIFARHFLV